MMDVRTCPRCHSTDVVRDNHALEDDQAGKVVFIKTTCRSCGFYTCSIAWNGPTEIEFRSWTSSGTVPDDAPRAVWEAL